jgi:V/A-type H+-transporting ATPase subunit D
MEQVSPTRMNMLIKRRQIKIAEQGASLLKSKRDALLQEFLSLIKPLLEERRKLDDTLKRALGVLASALGIDGPETLESAALASKREQLLKVEEKKIWGVRLPEIEGDTTVRSTITRGYAPFSVTSRVDMTAEAFERVVDLIIRMAPSEIKVKRLGAEIKKTTRRVNALEQRLIPELKSEVQFIRQILEDREREDKFRLKRLKAKKLKKKGG